MKVLTLHQPWATLIALGVKTIETRGQAFRSLVGQRIAVHAAAKRPADVWHTWQSDPTFPPALDYLYDRGLCVDWFESANGDWHCWRWAGPLGAIVCTAVVTASVPMVDFDPAHQHEPFAHICLDDRPDSLARLYPGSVERDYGDDITDQLPYGDFRPGRYGLLLADVSRLAKPLPFKGGQGLTRSIDEAELAEWEAAA